jgi:protein arginine N-methyltransferase 5
MIKKTTVTIMVVGAGRGPLVNRALEAADRAKYKVHIYAVEKNPMAIISLYSQKQEWGNRVTIIHEDMRSWKADCQADIMVSELLGSFGDNELSPECLDGAQRYLKADGISIPYSYTSFICPVQSPRIFSELLYNRDANKPYYANFETPFVVYLHNCFFLAETKPLFTFEHPNFSTPIDNSRYGEVEFTIPTTGTMHGLAGFFEAKLYKDIAISIEPNTHSKNLISWFPMFFPIREPVTLPADSKIKVTFWRCCSSSQVWYEWTMIEPTTLPIHNPTGRSFSIGK